MHKVKSYYLYVGKKEFDVSTTEGYNDYLDYKYDRFNLIIVSCVAGITILIGVLYYMT